MDEDEALQQLAEEYVARLLEIEPEEKPKVLFEVKPKKIVGFASLAATDGGAVTDRLNLSRSKSVSFKPIELASEEK